MPKAYTAFLEAKAGLGIDPESMAAGFFKNLLKAPTGKLSVILWNTVYLEKAFAEVRDRQNVPDEFLTYLSPLGWDHINLTGDYVWKLDP